MCFQGLGERKKKHVADKKKFEEEVEELRAQQEVSKCMNFHVSLQCFQGILPVRFQLKPF